MPYAEVNGIRLYYETQGQGQPLVFLHGLGSSTRDWEAQVPAFANDYQVITLDLRGHGQSDKPAGPYSLPLFASDTVGLLEELGVGPAHIVGISLGGGIAFQIALDAPDRVKTLTIVNSGPSMGASLEDVKAEVERRAAIVQQMGMHAMGLALSGALFPKPEQAALRDTFVQRWSENDPRAYIEATRATVGWSVTDKLGSIRCPTLVITADQDYSPVALKEAYVKAMPDARLVVISDAHHGTPIEKPEEFNRVLMEFLKERG